MAKRMLIDALHAEETRIAIADDNQIFDFDFVSTAKKQLKGNIYLAKITRVEPSLQAAFVEYGGGKQGFLPFSEIHTDYYQIPASDRKRLMEEAAREDAHDTEQADDNAVAENHEPVNEPHDAAAENAQPFPLSSEMQGATLMENQEHPQLELSHGPAEEAAHPAYLTEGAIDFSISETLEAHEEQATPATEPEGQPAPEEAKTPEAAPAEDVETLPNEEDEFQARPKKNVFLKRYKIQEVIRRGQIVLVQVIKEERGNKGVSLTTYLSLAGRYCVLMPNSPKDGGISRKIASGEDRKRLKAISTELRLAQGMSVIIRTAGLDRTRAEIKRDFDYLVKLWNRIREDTLASTAPALVYEESDIIKRAIRDQYTSDIDEVIVEGDEGYKSAKEFMKLLLPSHTPKIKHHKEPTPLFYAYGIEDQLLSMHDPVVKLKSGGYLVINPTEALISIDVNSGRATGERNIEETAAKTNLEAAAEVARQLRLRDLAGLIVIDFIDMMESRNRRNVEKMLKDSLKMDRAKIQLGRISPFGLLEMSRQRLRPSISETNMVQCPHCVGRGVVRSNESMSIQVIRAIEKEASMGQWGSLRVLAPHTTALHLLNAKRDALRDIEQRYGIIIAIAIGADLTTSDFTIEKTRRATGDKHSERPERLERERRPRNENNRPERAQKHAEAPAPLMEDAEPDSAELADDETTGSDDARKTRARRGRRGRSRRGERPASAGEPLAADAGEAIATDDSETLAEAPALESEGQSPRTPRPRTDRGRRRWRDRGGREERARPETTFEPVMETAHAETHSYNAESAATQPAESPRWSEETTIPAFATRDVIMPPPARNVEPPKPAESTPRDPNAPVKKGWWQKMIELDD